MNFRIAKACIISSLTCLALLICITAPGVSQSKSFDKAKENGAKIIEINIKPSHFTDTITDIFLEMKATEAMKEIGKLLYLQMIPGHIL